MPDSIQLKVAPNGRVVIPAEFRSRLGLSEGGRVIARLVGDAIVLEPVAAAVRRAQDTVARFVRPGTSLVDELTAERRRASTDE